MKEVYKYNYTCMKINAIAIVLFKNDMIVMIHERDKMTSKPLV